MLIVYDLTSGEVLLNTGTNSAMPLGPSDEWAYDHIDAARDTVGLLRLRDIDDADLVEQVLTNRNHVDPTSGHVIIDGPYPGDTSAATRESAC